MPNPNLRPEVGKNKEIGFNLKKNDVFTSGDSFRGKFNVFRNDITDYIDQVAFGHAAHCSNRAAACAEHSVLPFLQYQNIAAGQNSGLRGRDDV